MARRKGQSLGRKDVVAAGLVSIEEEGPDALNVNRVAQRLGIRTPSLYNHVAGADDLRQAVVLEVLERAAREIVLDPKDELEPMSFIRALAYGLRRFALANANLYLFLMATPLSWDADPFTPHWARTQERFTASVAGFKLSPEETLHAARYVTAAIQGFIRLELRGSYTKHGLTDESFEWMLDQVSTTLKSRSEAVQRAAGAA